MPGSKMAILCRILAEWRKHNAILKGQATDGNRLEHFGNRVIFWLRVRSGTGWWLLSWGEVWYLGQRLAMERIYLRNTRTPFAGLLGMPGTLAVWPCSLAMAWWDNILLCYSPVVQILERWGIWKVYTEILKDAWMELSTLTGAEFGSTYTLCLYLPAFFPLTLVVTLAVTLFIGWFLH